ncbi:hypothetical protein niasHS_018130 [Heterodera schachtii]|uniref:Ubiquitin-like domain-containing protein n=1 Tax=Heterodera schachtii TaxID=97005 RepID=A0ABD2HX99_HETSC
MQTLGLKKTDVVTADEKFANEGDQFTVYVNGRETMEDLKEKIMKIMGKNGKTTLGSDRSYPGRLTLQYGQNDEFMNSKKTIDEYGIKKDDTIRLSIGEFLIILWQFGKKNEVKGYHVWVKSEETVAILKKKVRITTDEQIFKKQLKKELRTTNTITVEVNGTDKVDNLKKKIIGKMTEESKTKFGTDPKRLTLKYDENDNYDILNDVKAIDYYLNRKASTVRLSIGEFRIVVRYAKLDKNYNIWMNSKETVATLKKKIQNESKINPEQQILKCDTNGNGGTVTVLEDKKAMTDYGIGEGTTVLLFTEFQIFVKYKKDNEQKTFTVRISGTDNAYQLRKEIMKEMRKVFPMIKSVEINDSQSSEFNEERYGKNSTKTLKSCGIGEGSTIYLVSYGLNHPVTGEWMEVKLM